MFLLLKEMRANIVAPVDTIGCASLADRYEDEKVSVFQKQQNLSSLFVDYPIPNTGFVTFVIPNER